VLGVDPVGHAGVVVRDDEADAGVGVGVGLLHVEARLAVREVAGVEAEAVVHRPTPIVRVGEVGRDEPSLGGSGAVRRDVPLDPDLIKDGRLPPAGPRSNTQ
jgi:hypothetical protein